MKTVPRWIAPAGCSDSDRTCGNSRTFEYCTWVGTGSDKEAFLSRWSMRGLDGHLATYALDCSDVFDPAGTLGLK